MSHFYMYVTFCNLICIQADKFYYSQYTEHVRECVLPMLATGAGLRIIYNEKNLRAATLHLYYSSISAHSGGLLIDGTVHAGMARDTACH